MSYRRHVPSSALLAFAAAGSLLALGCATSPRPAPAPTDPSASAAEEPAAEEPTADEPAPAAGARCVTIERGVLGDVKDTRIASSAPDRNYGALGTTNAGRVDEKERLALLSFDLSAVPRGSTVVSARLTLRRASLSEAKFTVHSVAAAWDERTVTWSSFDGAYSERVEASFWTRADGSGDAVADITPLVRQWILGERANHGIAIVPGDGEGPMSLGAFHSSEAKSPADRPRLEVCFAPDPASAL